MRRTLLALPLVAALVGFGGCEADAPRPAPPEPPPAAPGATVAHDPDLDAGASCPERPRAETLVAALPTYIKELVLLHPRAGARIEGERCTSVARLTLLNHQGVPITLTFELHPDAVQPRSFRRILDDGMPRASVELQPLPEHPQLLVLFDGAPSMDEDLLRTTIEFMDLPALSQALLSAGPGTPDGPTSP